MSTSQLLVAGAAVAWLAITAAPARAGDMPGLAGPAASAVLHALTDGELIHCVDPDGHDIDCQVRRNDVQPHLFYGDASGHGPNADVLAITFYNDDPTGNAEMVSVASFRLEGGRYRSVRTFPRVSMAGIAPGSEVVFRDGHVSFVAVTLRPQDSLADPQGRTRYVLDLR